MVPPIDPHGELFLHCWYLDDGLLCGPRESVLRALKLLQQETPKTGLALKLEKCELYS